MAEKIFAAKCRTCGLELRINRQDNAETALKRKRWSNVWKDVDGCTTGVCRKGKKQGQH